MAGNVNQPACDVETRLGKRTGEDGRGVTARENGEQHDADLSSEAEANRFGDGLHVRVSRLTAKSSATRPRGRTIATAARWPGSLQRIVRRRSHISISNSPKAEQAP